MGKKKKTRKEVEFRTKKFYTKIKEFNKNTMHFS